MTRHVKTCQEVTKHDQTCFLVLMSSYWTSLAMKDWLSMSMEGRDLW